MNERCGNCRFHSSPPGGYAGHICRRRAPTPLNVELTRRSQDGGVALWPVIGPWEDWCGDWQLSEDSEQEEWD
jgi:hypothetical protein